MARAWVRCFLVVGTRSRRRWLRRCGKHGLVAVRVMTTLASSSAGTRTTTVKFKNLEVLCYQGTIEAFRKKTRSLDDTLVTHDIYKNARKGDRASEAEIQQALDHHQMKQALEEIVLKGEYQLSVEERKELIRQMRKRIVQFFHHNYMDPKTNLPHPITRLEAALSDIKSLRITINESPESQAKAILKKLIVILPMKSNAMEATVVVPHTLIGQAQGKLRSLSTVRNSEYTSTGCIMKIAFLSGNFQALLDFVNKHDGIEFALDGANVAAEGRLPGGAASAGAGKKKKKKGKGLLFGGKKKA